MQLYNIQGQWQTWILFFLVFQLLLTGILQPAAVTTCFKMVGASIQRQYIEKNNDKIVQALQRLFQWGTLSFCLILVVQNQQLDTIGISLAQYGAVAGYVLAVSGIKYLLDRAVYFVCYPPVLPYTYFRHRCMLWVIVCLLLLIHLLVAPSMSASLRWIIPAIIYALFVIVLTGKILKMVGLSFKHIIYLVIYIIHLEILPMAALLIGTNYIMHVLHV